MANPFSSLRNTGAATRAMKFVAVSCIAALFPLAGCASIDRHLDGNPNRFHDKGGPSQAALKQMERQKASGVAVNRYLVREGDARYIPPTMAEQRYNNYVGGTQMLADGVVAAAMAPLALIFNTEFGVAPSGRGPDETLYLWGVHPDDVLYGLRPGGREYYGPFGDPWPGYD